MSVLPKFDVESTKTVGLTNLIAAEAEAGRPALRPVLEQRGPQHPPPVLRWGCCRLFRPAHAADIPRRPSAPQDETWYGSPRAVGCSWSTRGLVPQDELPRGIESLTEPKWKGKVGDRQAPVRTTATHATCLFAAWGADKAKAYFQALKANGARVVSGKKRPRRPSARAKPRWG